MDDRGSQLRRTRLATRVVVALASVGALGASTAIAWTVLPGVAAPEDTTPSDGGGVVTGDEDDGWAVLPNTWNAPDRGISPGGGGSHHGTSSGS